MRSFIDFSSVRPQNPDLIWVKLHPETPAEKKVLTDNSDTPTIEGYYRAAIKHKLPEYEIVAIADQSQWPDSAQVRVKKV